MKNVRLASFLLVLTIVLAVFAVSNIYRYFLYTYRMQNLQYQFATMDNTRQIMQSLATEAVQYSQKNRAIDPLLQSFDIKTKPTNAPAAAIPTQPLAK